MNAAAVVVAATDPLTCEAGARWAAALGASAEPAEHVAAVRRRWSDALAVVVDAAMARRLLEAGVPRRRHVLLVDPEVTGERVWRSAVDLGVELVCRPDAEAQPEALDVLRSALDGRGDACAVAVVGAVGGVGASTLAAGVALAAARSWRTVLCDLDPTGGIDLVLGAESVEGARWDTLDLAGGRLPAGALVDVLPRHDGVAFLTRARDAAGFVSEAAHGVVTAARRAADAVVLDVPRHPSALQVVERAELTIVVVPEDVHGIAAGRHLVRDLHDVAGAVVAIGAARPGGLGPEALAEHLAVPVVGRLRYRRTLRRAVTAGRGPTGSRDLRRAAEAVLDLVGLDLAAPDLAGPDLVGSDLVGLAGQQ